MSDPDYLCSCGRWADKQTGCDCDLDQFDENLAENERHDDE